MKSLLIIIILLFLSSCTHLDMDPAVYREIRRCNDKVDMERLGYPERGTDYDECVPLTTILRF